jgi:ubiquinone/menaquinone biosynthesis C-methylase UbiE
LAKRTRYHWINADINPHFFGYFYSLAETSGLTGRVSAVMADAQDLPFRDRYADIVVSRGSYRFWPDKEKAFSEVYRVLKPGGLAFIGRGFSPNLPIETALKIRGAQGQSMDYSFAAKAAELNTIMRSLGITDFKIHNPSSGHAGKANYGIWIEFHKPRDAGQEP